MRTFWDIEVPHSDYEPGPRRHAWCHFALQPKTLVEIVKMPDNRSLFADVREYIPYFDEYNEHSALIEYLEVIPVIRAHVFGTPGNMRWLWYAKVPGLLSDGLHASIDPGYATKAEALMAGLEKYPTGVVA